MSIAVIYGSSREGGNTELLTKTALQGLDYEEIILRDETIIPVKDGRHEDQGFSEVDDNYDALISRMINHDILVFATPIYWFSMSGTMKTFIDRWSQTMRDEKHPEFKEKMAGKQAYVIAVGGDTPLLKGLPLIQQFQLIFQFIGTTFSGYIIGKGNRPGEVLQDQQAMAAAEGLRQTLLSER
ncbi:flavodoxin family protein [Evansella halocellulosilytica]|uniref:flavodoxin family protein n=1 Tax=Evansella halocellulosilytica TaxID=2011013 RepID=UPI000BB7DD2F|nr:flavodoxin family protein [Evansella halocellulosilytica]